MANKRELQVLVTAKDQASSKLKKLSANIEKGLKKTSVAATALSGALFVASSKAIDAFQKQERAEKRLETITRQTTNATDAQIKALEDQAQALQKVGVIGDEVTVFGQSQLATFALQTDAIKELTPAMLDMAVATKGVNANQQDMIDIGNMIGKVMQGQVGALSRVGVTFNETQAEILKTGNEMERAAALAEILDQNFGGLNEKMAETSEGGMAQLRNDFGDMLEVVGEALIPVLTQLVEDIKPIIKSLADWSKENKDLIALIFKIMAVVLPLTAAMWPLVAGIKAVSAALIFLHANPISLAIAGIAALVAGVVYLIANFDTLKENVVLVWNQVAALIEEKAGFIIKSVRGVTTAVKEAIDAMNKFNRGRAISDDLAGFQAQFPAPQIQRASGGNVFPGQSVLVGENGPERFIPSSSGQIVPNENSGSTINVNVTGNNIQSPADENSLANKVAETLARTLQLRELGAPA